MEDEIRKAVERLENVSIAPVDGEDAIIVECMKDYDKIQEILKGFDSDDVYEIPIHFDEELWYCSGCNEWHTTEDTATAMLCYDDCEQFCDDAIRENEELHGMYIEYLTNNADACNLLGKQFLVKQGWKEVETHDVGMYGYEDGITPGEILEKYEKDDVIFSLDNNNPFTTKYSVWVREEG